MGESLFWLLKGSSVRHAVGRLLDAAGAGDRPVKVAALALLGITAVTCCALKFCVWIVIADTHGGMVDALPGGATLVVALVAQVGEIVTVGDCPG